MNQAPNLYIERLKAVRQGLRLALKLLEKRPDLGVLAILKRVYHLLPYNADRTLKKFPYKAQNRRERQILFWNAFEKFTRMIIGRLGEMNKKTASGILSKIEVELSMSLFPDDPAAKENDDNLLFNILIPWQDLWPFIQDRSSRPSGHPEERLYHYILRNSIPYIEEEDFSRAGSMDVNLTLYETRAWKLNGSKAVSLSPLETDELLSMESLAAFAGRDSDNSVSGNDKGVYIRRLVSLIEKLLSLYPERSGMADELALQIEFMLHDFNLVDSFNYESECLLECGKWPDWKDFNNTHHKAMKFLDGFMRELEELAVAWKKGVHAIDREDIQDGPYTFYEYQCPDDNIITFWTGKEGWPHAVPFWEESTGTGLFLDGEDWHEFHPFKPMCYLSHIVFVDGDINFKELEFIDYMSWQMSFSNGIGISWSA